MLKYLLSWSVGAIMRSPAWYMKNGYPVRCSELTSGDRIIKIGHGNKFYFIPWIQD